MAVARVSGFTVYRLYIPYYLRHANGVIIPNHPPPLKPFPYHPILSFYQNRHRGTFAGFAFEGYFPVVCFAYFFNIKQAETESFDIMDISSRDAVEFVKNPGLVLLVNSNPFVTDF